MKYTIENNGAGVVMIRVFIPEKLVASFIDFIELKDRQVPTFIKSPSPILDENYFIELNKLSKSTYFAFVSAGLPKKNAISATLNSLKSGRFHNISYDRLHKILTDLGCFRSKSAL